MSTHHSVHPDRGPLGALLTAAAAPAYPHELARLPTALAAYQDAGRRPVHHPPARSWLAKLLTVKAGILLTAAAAGGVALATTTGTLPNPLRHPPAVTIPTTPNGTVRPTNGPASHPAAPGTAHAPSLPPGVPASPADTSQPSGSPSDSPAPSPSATTEGHGKDKPSAHPSHPNH